MKEELPDFRAGGIFKGSEVFGKGKDKIISVTPTSKKLVEILVFYAESDLESVTPGAEIVAANFFPVFGLGGMKISRPTRTILKVHEEAIEKLL